MDKSYLNVDDRSNVDMLRKITSETKSKFQLIIRVFSIAFVMSVTELTEFLNMLTMKYQLRYKCWINTVLMILSMLIILLSEYNYYIPIQKIKLCSWNLDLK